MTEGQAAQLALTPEFQNRMTFALMKAAKTFMTDGAPANVALAKLVRDNPRTYVERFALMALTNITAAALAAITDINSVAQAAIDTQVTALWSTFAA